MTYMEASVELTLHTLASLRVYHTTAVHLLEVRCDPSFAKVIEASNCLALLKVVLSHQSLPHILELSQSKRVVYDGNQMLLQTVMLRV